MKIKKILALLIAVAMTATVVGCGKDVEDDYNVGGESGGSDESEESVGKNTITDEKQLTKIENDFSSSISDILTGTDENAILITGVNEFNKDNFTIFADNAIGVFISEKLDFSIEDIEINDNIATATVNCSAPDLLAIIVSAVEDGETFENIDVEQYIKSQLDSNYPIIQASAETTFELVEGNWCWNPQKDILNVMSGNLYRYVEENLFSPFIG